jgi:hypothetical protein
VAVREKQSWCEVPECCYSARLPGSIAVTVREWYQVLEAGDTGNRDQTGPGMRERKLNACSRDMPQVQIEVIPLRMGDYDVSDLTAEVGGL